MNYLQQVLQESELSMKLVYPYLDINQVHLGGDQQIGSAIANNEMDMVIFFRDPLTAQPHEPDVTALIRLCDVYQIPLATNMGTAEILLKGIEEGFLDWRLLEERRAR